MTYATILIISVIQIIQINAIFLIYLIVITDMYTIPLILTIMFVAQRSGPYLRGLLTLVRDPMAEVTVQYQLSQNLNFDAFCLIQVILIICINVQVTALLETWEFQESARRKGHFATVLCWVIQNTMVSNWFTAIHFQPNPFTAVIAWTQS